MVESEAPELRAGVSGPPSAGRAGGRGAQLLLACAGLLGLLRFWRLGHWSLWYDEAITWADAHHALAADGLYNPVGYLAIRQTVEWLGGVPDEFALRFLPALAGWLAIPLTYWAFAPGAGRLRAALAALLVAVSPWQLYWSQNARFYTLAQAMGLLGGGLLLRAFLVPGGRRRTVWQLLAGAACVSLGALFHLQNVLLFCALVVAPFGLRALRAPLGQEGRRAALLLAGCAALVGLAGSPWALEAWHTYEGKKSLGSIPGRLAHFALSTGFYLSPLLAAAFAVACWGALRARDTFFVLCGLVAGLGLIAAGAASVLARVTAQYVFVFSPWVALLATWPVGAACRAPMLRFAYSALLVAPTLAGSVLYQTVRYGERPRWREAYEYVWNHRGPEDLILGMVAPVGEYYLHPGATDLREPVRVAWLDSFRAAVPHRWGRTARRTWFVVRPDYVEDWPEEDRASLWRLLHEDCRLAQRFPVTVEGRGLDLEVYVRDAR